MFNLSFYTMLLFFRHKKDSGSWSIHKGENFFNENCILVRNTSIFEKSESFQRKIEKVWDIEKFKFRKLCENDRVPTFFNVKVFR